jgi:hypothetical protein
MQHKAQLTRRRSSSRRESPGGGSGRGSRARSRKSSPSPSPPNYTIAAGAAEHLSIYGRAWALHQLVPFVDKILGLAGAMDNRMLGVHDFWLRLPIVLLALAKPSTAVLLVAHIINIGSWAYWMPAVWDYMVWCAILELAFVAAALRGGGDDAVGRRTVRVLRPMLIILYFSAAFWKLTSGWFDTRGSCAPVLMSELFSSSLFHSAASPAWWEGVLLANLRASPFTVAGLEFAVPTGEAPPGS